LTQKRGDMHFCLVRGGIFVHNDLNNLIK